MGCHQSSSTEPCYQALRCVAAVLEFVIILSLNYILYVNLEGTVEHVRGLGIWNHITYDCLPLYPFLPGRGFHPPTPQPLALWAQSSVSFLTLTSQHCHSFSTLCEDWTWHREGCGQVCTTVGMAGVIPSQVGRAIACSSRDSAGQAPHLPPLHALCGSSCGGRSPRGCLSVCGSGGRPRRRADAWLSFLTPNRAWTIVSVVGRGKSLAVGGPLSCRTGSPCTYEDLHLTCQYLHVQGSEAFHSKNQISWPVERNCREGEKLFNVRALFFIFLNKDLQIVILSQILQIVQPVL